MLTPVLVNEKRLANDPTALVPAYDLPRHPAAFETAPDPRHLQRVVGWLVLRSGLMIDS